MKNNEKLGINSLLNYTLTQTKVYRMGFCDRELCRKSKKPNSAGKFYTFYQISFSK